MFECLCLSRFFPLFRTDSCQRYFKDERSLFDFILHTVPGRFSKTFKLLYSLFACHTIVVKYVKDFASLCEINNFDYSILSVYFNLHFLFVMFLNYLLTHSRNLASSLKVVARKQRYTGVFRAIVAACVNNERPRIPSDACISKLLGKQTEINNAYLISHLCVPFFFID